MNMNKPLFAIAVIGLIIIALGLVFTSSAKDNFTKNMVDQYKTQELIIAQEVALVLEGEVKGIREKLDLIARLPEVRDGDTQTCGKKLEEVFVGMKERVTNLGRMNASGIFYCSVNKAAIGIDGKQYAHLKKIIDERKPVLGYVLNNTNPSTSLHVPIFDENNTFKGTLGGAIQFSDLQEKYLKDIKFLKQGYVTLLDDNGDLLFHPRPVFMGKNMWSEEMQTATKRNEDLNNMVKAVLQGKSGTASYLFEGKLKVAAYVPAFVFPDRVWGVVVTVPIEDILKSAKVEETFFQINIILLLFLIPVAGAFYLSLKKQGTPA